MGVRALLGYGAPAFALALFGVPVFVHIPKFYADVVGAPLEGLGIAILLTRVLDGVLDPLVGAWSDRVRTRWGRRRPFLVAAALPLGIGAAGLFAPTLTGADAVWWFAAAMSASFVAWTAVQVPHAALGAELTFDHHQRTTLFAVRDGLWMAGTLVAAAAPAVTRSLMWSEDGPPDERAVFRTLGVAYAALLIVLPLWCAWSTREPPAPDHPLPMHPPGRLLRDALANGPYRTLLAAYAVAALGGALPGTLLFFYVDYVLGAPEWGDAFLALYFLSGFACLPGWAWVARRTGKKRAFVIATGMSVAVFGSAVLLGRGDAPWFAAITVLSGAGFGASLTLPSSMLADTLDYDELLTGERREGLFMGLWGITMKGSAALGAGVALPLIGWAGYVAGSPPLPAAVLAIRLLYCAIPCLCYAAALGIVWRYPIDEQEHRAIRSAIDRRGGGGQDFC